MINRLETDGRAANTVNGYVAAVRVFYEVLRIPLDDRDRRYLQRITLQGVAET